MEIPKKTIFGNLRRNQTQVVYPQIPNLIRCKQMSRGMFEPSTNKLKVIATREKQHSLSQAPKHPSQTPSSGGKVTSSVEAERKSLAYG